MGLIKEFREFALKGNMMDMAVGIIIGGAFGVIIKSLIDDVIMPIVSIPGKVDFSNLYIPLSTKVSEANEAAGLTLPLADARALGPVLAYGNFITVFINFVILALAIFMVIKMMNTARKRFEKQQEIEAAAPAVPPAEVLLLTEIRDELRAKRL
jgi:large conductance mechanosensitive channel